MIAAGGGLAPVVPKGAQNQGVSGAASFLVYVLPSGQVERIELVSSSGRDAWDRTFLQFIQQQIRWRANDVPYRVPVEIRFDANHTHAEIQFGKVQYGAMNTGGR
ncbi:MAG: TonB family protein [Firmicutes bacterium]|nr:TonB family protein [Bacillota bacterium]